MTEQARAVAQRLREHTLHYSEQEAAADVFDALCAEVERLRGALAYHQEQTRPIQRTIDVLEGTK